MQEYFVTVPDLDLIDEPIRAHTSKQAALKTIKQHQNPVSAFDSDETFEVIVRNERGKSFIHVFRMEISFRCLKAV